MDAIVDHLKRTPLLLEFSSPSAQHGRPGGAVKSRTRMLRQKTSATMPHKDAPLQKFGRRVMSNVRGWEARDTKRGFAQRKAKRTREENRPVLSPTKARNNPNAPSDRLRRRGNPLASKKTEVRESPSRNQRRPTLAKTPKFYSRGDFMKGHRL